jgi:hypothetical protein
MHKKKDNTSGVVYDSTIGPRMLAKHDWRAVCIRTHDATVRIQDEITVELETCVSGFFLRIFFSFFFFNVALTLFFWLHNRHFKRNQPGAFLFKKQVFSCFNFSIEINFISRMLGDSPMYSIWDVFSSPHTIDNFIITILGRHQKILFWFQTHYWFKSNGMYAVQFENGVNGTDMHWHRFPDSFVLFSFYVKSLQWILFEYRTIVCITT